MSDEENDQNGENQCEKTKLLKPKSIDKVFGKPDSSVKFLQWSIKSKLSQDCKVGLSNSSSQRKGPWLKQTKLKVDFKNAPVSASFSMKPLSGKGADSNSIDASFSGTYENTKLNFKIKDKGELGFKLTQNIGLVGNILKAKLDYNWSYKNFMYKNTASGHLDYHNSGSMLSLSSKRLQVESLIKLFVDSSREGSLTLQGIFNLAKNPVIPQQMQIQQKAQKIISVSQNSNNNNQSPAQDEAKGKESKDKQRGEKEKKDILYKAMITNKIVYNSNNPYAKTSTVFQNCKKGSSYQVDGTLKYDGSLSLDLFARFRLTRNIIAGVMKGVYTDRDRLCDKTEVNAEIDKVKYLGKVQAAVTSKNAMIKIFPKWGRTFSAQAVIQKSLRNRNFNYGFKLTYNI